MAKFVPQAELPVSEQAQIRRDKLAALQAEGRDPFVQTKFDFNADSVTIKADYEGFEGTAIVPITANVDEAAVAFYFNAMNALDFPYYEYETIIEGLVADGAVEETTSYYAFEFDTAYTFFGVAEDADGNFTEVWSSKDTTFKVDGCSPAEEFFAAPSAMGTRKGVKAEQSRLSVE